MHTQLNEEAWPPWLSKSSILFIPSYSKSCAHMLEFVHKSRLYSRDSRDLRVDTSTNSSQSGSDLLENRRGAVLKSHRGQMYARYLSSSKLANTPRNSNRCWRLLFSIKMKTTLPSRKLHSIERADNNFYALSYVSHQSMFHFLAHLLQISVVDIHMYAS